MKLSIRESSPVGGRISKGRNDMPFLKLGKSERAGPDPSRPVRKSLKPADRAMFLIAIAASAVLSALLVIRVTHRGSPLGPGQMIMIAFVVSGALCLVRLSAAHRK
jgi:hypothetical protein